VGVAAQLIAEAYRADISRIINLTVSALIETDYATDHSAIMDKISEEFFRMIECIKSGTESYSPKTRQ